TRLLKQAKRAGIPSRLVASIRHLYESPRGWKWAQHHVINGVVYTHGDAIGGQYPRENLMKNLGSSVVIGHFHSIAGVSWMKFLARTSFGLSVGCLVDDTAPAFEYAKVSIRRSVLGAGVVLDGE